MELNFTNTTYTQVKFKRGKIKCLVCPRTDYYWCSVTEDDGLCLCNYETSDRKAKDGRNIHIIKESSIGNNQRIINSLEEKAEQPVAEIERLDAVYTSLLESLALSEHHSENLINDRGLSDNTISRNLYASVPSYNQRFEIAEKLAERFDLTNVPGFFQENGKWVLHLTFPGFYVPFRDAFGRISAMQLRRDDISEGKYWWLSSEGKDKGAKSTNPVHIVNPHIINRDKTVFITEGALKADVIAEFYEVGLAAIGGVLSFTPINLINQLQEAFPDLQKVVVAFDMDWKTKDKVRGAIYRLVAALKESPLETSVLTWNLELGKGLDDLLKYASDEEINPDDVLTFVSAEEFQQKLDDVAEQEASILKQEEMIETDDLNMGLKANLATTKNTFGMICRDFLNADFPKSEKVIFGLSRGSFGLVIASTNIGKTTMILNLALSVGMSKPFYPLLDESHAAKKIMYIDGEATKGDLQADIKKMMESCSQEQQESIKDNLCFICDEELNEEPLDLVNPEHLRIVTEKAIDFEPDLIIIDTLSALTTLEDENNNAKVKEEIIQPLKSFGKKVNAGILVLHHVGKYQEGSTQHTTPYGGRGASAFGALARVVFNINPIKNNAAVKFFASKVKGENFEPVTMQLDQTTRWFRQIEGIIESKSQQKKRKSDSNYEKLINFITIRQLDTLEPVQRKTIIDALENEINKTAIGRFLRAALENEDLTQPKTGFYSTVKNAEHEIPLE